jgi:sugar lactone lactonase YvrE
MPSANHLPIEDLSTNVLTNALSARARLGECPVWDTDSQQLYWVDTYNHRVHRFDPATGDNVIFDVEDVVGCIALAGKNRLILAQADRIAFLDTESGQLTPIKTIEADKPQNRFNDGKCDSHGRFWFGSVSQQSGEACLYRYDPDGSLQVMETELTIVNGLGWSPDDTTFYLTDSRPHLIYAYDFDPETGSIKNRRVLIDLSHENFEPDGLAIDSQGFLWSAMWDGWRIIRFNPQGEAVSQIELPIPRPTCCTFGGKTLTSLYITSASVDLSQAEIQKSVCSGDLFCVETNVKGMPAYSFGSTSH